VGCFPITGKNNDGLQVCVFFDNPFQGSGLGMHIFKAITIYQIRRIEMNKISGEKVVKRYLIQLMLFVILCAQCNAMITADEAGVVKATGIVERINLSSGNITIDRKKFWISPDRIDVLEGIKKKDTVQFVYGKGEKKELLIYIKKINKG
jgi:Cu/Ag efflux protein CusF